MAGRAIALGMSRNLHRPFGNSVASTGVRGFVNSPVCYGMGSHASDNDPEVLEKEKQRNLKGEVKSSIPNAHGWNEKLASDSEAAVKAERHADGKSIEELQAQTAEHHEKAHKENA